LSIRVGEALESYNHLLGVKRRSCDLVLQVRY
jgi:hypothetical protein